MTSCHPVRIADESHNNGVGLMPKPRKPATTPAQTASPSGFDKLSALTDSRLIDLVNNFLVTEREAVQARARCLR